MLRLIYTIGLALTLAVLLAVRLPLLRCGVFGADVPNFNDEINYVALAHSLANGDTSADTTWAWTRAPATSLLLLGLSQLRNLPPEFVVCDFQRVQVALWCGLLLLVAGITRVLFGRRAALLAALVVALAPEVLLLALLVYSETLFSAGLLLAVAALLAHSRRPHWGWLVLAGGAAGFGALARSSMLPLLPVLALWAGLRPTARIPDAATRQRGSGFRIRNAAFAMLHSQFSIPRVLVFLLVTMVVIAPWTYRNYRLYGGLIIIDTTAAHGLWASNTSVERGVVNQQVSRFSPNPVERQRFASQQGIATIMANPGVFAAKLAHESLGSWAPRDFVVRREFWSDFLQRPLVGTLLAQFDALLAITLPLALLGVLFAPHSAPGARHYRLGVVGLALLFTLMMAVTHFEGRYRTPFWLLLLPYAAWCVTHPRALFNALRQPRLHGYSPLRPPLALAITFALAVVFAPNLWPAQWQSARTLALYGTGLLRERWGDLPGALANQRAALALQPTLQEASLAAARVATTQGDTAMAERLLGQALLQAHDDKDDAPEIVVALRGLLYAQGRTEEAERLDNGLSIPDRRRAELLAWGQGLQPQAQLQAGTGDFGLIEGFYSRQFAENVSFRWSRPAARLLLAGSGDQVCLQLSADRPLHIPAPTVTLEALVAGQPVLLGSLKLPRRGWAWGCVPAPQRSSGLLELHLRTTAYNPYLLQQGPDTRDLGVALAQAELRSGPLTLDPSTGLLLDRPAPGAEALLRVIGASGAFSGQPGGLLPFTLWWRGTHSPPAGTFTFLHLIDAGGVTVAAYNAPLAAGQLPLPWVAGEPLADQAALPLPDTLLPGSYQLQIGAFDPASGRVLASTTLGTLEVTP